MTPPLPASRTAPVGAYAPSRGRPSTAAAVRDPARLAALRATGVLDTPADAVLDRLTRHAARVLAAPVAMVSLVDEHRQFLGSYVGIPEPWATAREFPLCQSICQYVVASAAPLIIDDARRHALLHDHPAVHDLGVAAYAGVPIVTQSGAVLGSFCAVDVTPRHWTPADVDVLTDLASAATAVLDLRAAHARLALQEAELRDLLDHTDELVVTTDAAGRIAFTNRAWREVMGHAPDEVTQLHPAALVAPEHRGRYRGAVLRLLKGEAVRDLDVAVLARDGRRILCRCWAVPRMAPGPDDRPVCVGARVGYRVLPAGA